MNWIYPAVTGIWQGFLIGLLSFGPAFFSLIHTGMQKGKKAGFQMALGIFLSEFTLAMLYFFGLGSLFANIYFQLSFSFLAATSIIYLGISGAVVKYDKFLKKMSKPQTNKKLNSVVLKGFYLNIINPFAIAGWGIILGSVSLKYSNGDKYSILVNIITILLTLFALDLYKVYLSDYLGRKLNNRIYYYVNKYFGFILLGIGLLFLYKFITLCIQYCNGL